MILLSYADIIIISYNYVNTADDFYKPVLNVNCFTAANLFIMKVIV